MCGYYLVYNIDIDLLYFGSKYQRCKWELLNINCSRINQWTIAIYAQRLLSQLQQGDQQFYSQIKDDHDHELNMVYLPLLLISVNGYLPFNNHHGSTYHTIKERHGSSGKWWRSRKIAHRKASHIIFIPQFFLCYFWEYIEKKLLCKVWNYWVRSFLELKCQLYQTKLRYQLKSWNLE